MLEDGETSDGTTYTFWCPGCSLIHTFNTNRPDGRHPCWVFDGNMEHPTFSPPLRIRGRLNHKGRYPESGANDMCHSFVVAGKIQFFGDCTHKLAGQTVDLPEIPKDQEW
jgi:hypothetical protein